MEFTAIAYCDDLHNHGDEARPDMRGCIRIFDTDEEEIDTIDYLPGETREQTLASLRESISKSRYRSTRPWNYARGCYHTCLTD